MIDSIPPGLLLMLGAAVLPLFRGKGLQAALLVLPVASGALLAYQARDVLDLAGDESKVLLQVGLFDYVITPFRIDRLSLVWGSIFHIAVFLCAVFALHVRDVLQHVAAFVYAGAAIGAVFAGDLLTLFVYWELTAVSSVFLVWSGGTRHSYDAGMRYLIIQVGSGVLLLAGVMIRLALHGTQGLEGDPLAFVKMSLDEPGALLIFLAFGIKAAFPLLHNWLQDAYPEASPTGTVFLSAFTTKLAIYALARGFAGTEQLIWIGAVMTAFPVFFAVIENDLRRVLSYSLNNQLGFMVVGIGLGTQLSLNGTAAHAFCHILYKSLLFMTMGAVLFRTGTAKGSELGGLYKSMPWTTAFCCIGGASISAFPLFSGFVSKSMIMSATANNHYEVVWFILLFASAGVLHHSGIKIPFFAFFAHDNGHRVPEAPRHMLIAMGVTATMCVLIGIFPGPLYALLPYEVDYHPYSRDHIITQIQLLMLAALGFTLMERTGWHPAEVPSVNLDTDWFYRKPGPVFVRGCYRAAGALRGFVVQQLQSLIRLASRGMDRFFGKDGIWGRTWSTGSGVLWAAILLGTYLLLYYL